MTIEGVLWKGTSPEWSEDLVPVSIFPFPGASVCRTNASKVPRVSDDIRCKIAHEYRTCSTDADQHRLIIFPTWIWQRSE